MIKLTIFGLQKQHLYKALNSTNKSDLSTIKHKEKSLFHNHGINKSLLKNTQEKEGKIDGKQSSN